MKKRWINLWFDDKSKCIETVSAFEEKEDETLYISLDLVRKMLEYEWPEGRWAVRCGEIDRED